MAGEDYRGAYNGSFRASIAKPPPGEGGVWVRCPRLNGAAKMPAQSCISVTYPDDEGKAVLVVTIAGQKDDLVIVAALR